MPRRKIRRVSWGTVLWITFLHLGVLAAPFYFTWKGVLIVFVLGWITGGIGVCLGYHRLLTHSSFDTYRWVRRSLTLIGVLAGQGPPLNWVAAHRKHHAFSDTDNDPHTPRHGGLWAHMLWLVPKLSRQELKDLHARYAPDLVKEAFMRFLGSTYLLWHFALGALLVAVGWSIWDPRTGVSFLVYGISVRLVYVFHITWFVNSATHMWGYRNYETKDDSRNLWWVGLLGWGEGWHNNHHWNPTAANHGQRWWEFDVTYITIRLMKIFGLATNVKVHRGA